MTSLRSPAATAPTPGAEVGRATGASEAPPPEATVDERFSWVARECGASILRVVSVYAPRAVDRDDLYQEVMYAIWRALPTFRGDAALRTFAYRIACNRGITHRARRGADGVGLEDIPEPASGQPGPDVAAEQADHVSRLHAAIRALSPVLRQVIILQLEGLSAPEIAGVIGVSENVVHVRAHRARAALRLALTALGVP